MKTHFQMQWWSDSSERPAQEFPPFSHHQFLKCATTAWNQGDMNHTQRKTIKNQPRSHLGWIYHIFQCAQSHTVGATFPDRWCVSGRINAGSTGSHRSTCESRESSHLQNGHSCVMNGQDVADVVLRQQLLILCICQSEETMTSWEFAPFNLHSVLMKDQR